MQMPKSLLVIQAVSDALGQILQAEGYNTSAGERVSRGRKFVEKDEDLPLLIVHEGPEEPSAKSSVSTVNNQLNLTVEGFCEADPLNPLDAGHYLLADIKKSLFPALGPGSYPGLIGSVAYGGRLIDPPEHGSRVCSVSVQLLVSWPENLTQPMQ